MPDKRNGRPIDDYEKAIVKGFCESDENSSMKPGMNDTVSVRIREGEKKVKVHKRLLLMKIYELYSKYKSYCSNSLLMKSCDRSKFFMMHLDNVVEVGSKGTHNVYVCEKNQIAKLMIDVLSRSIVEKYLMKDKVVCDDKAHNCMMNRYENCPGRESLRPCIVDLIGDREVIKYEMWISTDRSMLEQRECSSAIFIDLLLDKIEALTVHNFVAKEQSKFCPELKQNNIPTSVLLRKIFLKITPCLSKFIYKILQKGLNFNRVCE